MQCLRTLKITFSFLILLLSMKVFSKTPIKVDVSYSTMESQGVATTLATRNLKKQESIKTISIQSPVLQGGLQILATVDQAQKDYSDYVIQNKDGTESRLPRDQYQQETSGTITLNYRLNDYLLSLQRTQNLQDSPFAYQAHSVSISVEMNSKLTQLFSVLSEGSTKQPETYFTDLKTSERKQRPTSIGNKSYSLGVDQVLTEKLKTRFVFSLSQRTDRPEARGALVSSSYGVTQKDFARIDYKIIQESQQENLQNERGFFQLATAEFSYFRYLTYDFSINAGYGLVIETEDNPQLQRKDQIASDVFSLKAEYLSEKWSADLTVQSIASNVDYRSSQVKGAFSWLF